MPPKVDLALLAAVREKLYTAVVGDVLDRMGHLRHFLPPQVHPITPDMVVVGRAMPVVVENAPGSPEDPFGRLLEALDSLGEGDVYITNGGASEYALLPPPPQAAMTPTSARAPNNAKR